MALLQKNKVDSKYFFKGYSDDSFAPGVLFSSCRGVRYNAPARCDGENRNFERDLGHGSCLVATIIPPSFTECGFLEITAVTARNQSAFKKGMSQNERRSLCRKWVQQSSSRQLYSQSLTNLIARTDIRKFKDDDNHWIKESKMMRKQLFNAMVSQYSSALILLGVVNVDETVISKGSAEENS
jgi:hypothetical protein